MFWVTPAIKFHQLKAYEMPITLLQKYEHYKINQHMLEWYLPNGHVTIKLISLINNLSLSIDFLICCRFHKWVTSIHTAPEYRIVQEKNLLPQPHKFIYVKLNTMHSFELISLITCQHSLEMMYLYFYGWYT